MTNTTFSYTQKFAETLWIPFSAGTIRNCICNPDSTFQDFISGEDAWMTALGERFDFEHMAKLWDMILAQKNRVERLFN
jgi:hypothetical protein